MQNYTDLYEKQKLWYIYNCQVFNYFGETDIFKYDKKMLISQKSGNSKIYIDTM